MPDCVFCKIIRGELPSSKVYEDDKVAAFLDIHPVRDGHTLIVPKVHCDALLECAPEMLFNMIIATQKVARAIMKVTGAQGYNLGVNNGKAAGQVIFHLHMHIIPRTEGDGLRLWPSREYGPGEMQALAERIKQEVL